MTEITKDVKHVNIKTGDGVSHTVSREVWNKCFELLDSGECSMKKPLYLLNVNESRPLETCMLIDDSPEKVYAPIDCKRKHRTELYNYINIIRWFGDKDDTQADRELERISTKLFPKLQETDDVRDILKPYEQMDEIIEYFSDFYPRKSWSNTNGGNPLEEN